MRSVLAGLYLTTTCTLFAACSERSVEPVVIGIGIGNDVVPGVDVIRRYLEDMGDPPIDLIYDSLRPGEGTDLALTRAFELVNRPGVAVVVGHGASRSSLAAAPIYGEARIPLIIPTSTSDLLDDAGPWVFRMVPGNAAQGEFIGGFAVDSLRARSATIFFVTDEYGIGLRDGVTSALAARGVTVLDAVPVTSETETDFALLVEQSLLRGVPDVVVIAGRSLEVVGVIREFFAREPDVAFVSGDGANSDRLVLEGVSDAAGRYYRVAFWHPSRDDAVSRAFVEWFRFVAGREPSDSEAMRHDAIMLAAHAIHEVGPRPERIHEYLRSLGAERPPFAGVSGPVSFEAGPAGNLLMLKVDEGRIVARLGG